ncbi:hypothetical protein VPNG_02198 [Cytospora leucostoma]|uniref:Uncharacterized protein n=1 Tax=Cytospora leucostoma TaxID=1230097 RepID=A0A423XHK2_9PEZI|nr:hypothetical protein VPNG_02198 [Cytospora leucostoma]
MDDSSPSTFNTPKRKRNDVAREDARLPALNTHFSFDVSRDLLPDGGGGSPRTNVAHRFSGLALSDSTGTCNSGGGVTAPADGRHGLHGTDVADWATMDIDGDESKMRKRKRLSPVPSSPKLQKPAERTEIPDTPYAAKDQQIASADPNHLQPHLAPIDQSKSNSVAHGKIDPKALNLSSNVLPSKITKTYHTTDKSLAGTLKPTNHKRAGTPPLVAPNTRTGNHDQSGDPEAVIFDPVRASLTWHEDEITVYDPEDKDDDGTGINGIGFKPTPAIAYARTMKRRQQLADYKKREEREARARRSSRRRGSPERPKLERKPSVRKVRFTETDASTMITI